MNDGHTVVGIDGLKIEPLAPEICGRTVDGMRVPFAADPRLSEYCRAAG